LGFDNTLTRVHIIRMPERLESFFRREPAAEAALKLTVMQGMGSATVRRMAKAATTSPFGALPRMSSAARPLADGDRDAFRASIPPIEPTTSPISV
jgi:hypothetical protein